MQNEYDYFTAVDDLAPEDNTGAGHLGTVEFNSSTLYRYATVNLVELSNALGKQVAAETAAKFVEAFVRSMPTGKQNTFANRTLPSMVYVTIRRDQPLTFAVRLKSPFRQRTAVIRRNPKKSLLNTQTRFTASMPLSPIVHLQSVKPSENLRNANA